MTSPPLQHPHACTASSSTVPPSTPQLTPNWRPKHSPAAEHEAVGPLAAPPLPCLKQLDGAVVAGEAGLCPAGCTAEQLCKQCAAGRGKNDRRDLLPRPSSTQFMHGKPTFRQPSDSNVARPKVLHRETGVKPQARDFHSEHHHRGDNPKRAGQARFCGSTANRSTAEEAG